MGKFIFGEGFEVDLVDPSDYKVEIEFNPTPNPSAELIPPEKIAAIIKDFSDKSDNGDDVKSALSAVVKIIQDGGTNASKVNLSVVLNKKTFTVKLLREVILYHYPKGTVRKLARSMRDAVSSIAKINNWPGPLVRDLQISNPKLILSEQDKIYASEIHLDNYSEDMPIHVREALIVRQNYLSSRPNPNIKKGNPIPKRQAKAKKGKRKK